MYVYVYMYTYSCINKDYVFGSFNVLLNDIRLDKSFKTNVEFIPSI